ncbi:MAG: PilN domain-containing protein [Burkholderiales bacterium]|nr:PilN domain-containing protein [Burkholderiales bacterium]
MSAVPRIDFAQPQGPLRRRRLLAGWVLLALALAVAATTLGWHLKLRQAMQDEAALIERLRGGRDSAAREEPMSPATAAEIEAVNQVVRRLSVPWGHLFQAVEASKNARVYILSMKPDLLQRELKLSGEAEDFSAVTQFIDALGRQAALSQAHLASHETRPTGQIQFEVSAQWRP